MVKKEKKEEVVPPHLPKEVRQKGLGTAFWRLPVVKTLLWTVVFGFFSGLVGGLMVNTGPVSDWLWGPAGGGEINRKAEKPERQILARDALSKKAVNFLVSFYRQTPALVKDSLRRPEDFLGAGFFVTSDGWIAASEEVIGRFGRKELAVLTADNKVYQIREMAADPISDLILLKIDSGNFSAPPFIFSDLLDNGTALWIPTLSDGLRPTELVFNSQFSISGRKDLYHSSEKIYRLNFLKDGFSSASRGLPVLNVKGEAAGLLTGPSVFLKSSLIDSALKSVLKYKEVRRAFLGVHFVETESLIGADLTYGVKLADDPSRGLPALEKESPLSALGLRAGDIIVSVNGETITVRRSLPDILADYAPGAEVEIKYLRGQEEKTVAVKLGVIK